MERHPERLAESRGTGGAFEFVLPDWASAAAEVNLLERQAQPLAMEAGRLRFNLRLWEIAALRILLQTRA